jgi:hypothetical protein
VAGPGAHHNYTQQRHGQIPDNFCMTKLNSDLQSCRSGEEKAKAYMEVPLQRI